MEKLTTADALANQARKLEDEQRVRVEEAETEAKRQYERAAEQTARAVKAEASLAKLESLVALVAARDDISGEAMELLRGSTPAVSEPEWRKAQENRPDKANATKPRYICGSCSATSNMQSYGACPGRESSSANHLWIPYAPCAQCGAANAPYVEHRCVLHVGGQTEQRVNHEIPASLRDACDEVVAQAIDDDGGCRICCGYNGSREGHEDNCAILMLQEAMSSSAERR